MCVDGILLSYLYEEGPSVYFMMCLSCLGLCQMLLSNQESNTSSKRAAPATMPASGLKVLWAYEYAQKRKNCTGKFKGSLPGN